MTDPLIAAKQMINQVRGAAPPWSEAEWWDAVQECTEACRSESSIRQLGEVLRLDEALELPVELMVAVYRRLIALDVSDARTMVCFARYLLLHGPDCDDEANALLRSVEQDAKRAGIWNADHLGHHPVFFVDPPSGSK